MRTLIYKFHEKYRIELINGNDYSIFNHLLEKKK